MPDQQAMPPEVAAKVSQHTKAIRYQARRDGVPLPKAFNDYVGKNSLSGTERTAVRKKLGMMEEKGKSDWRNDLREVVQIEDKEKVREVKDKKVSNIVKINPVQSEAFAEIGGKLLEITEEEMPGDDKKKEDADALRDKQLRHSKQMMRKRQILDRQRLQMQKAGKLPMGHSEGLDLKKASMGEVIKDFRKSDAPQFEGKSKKKKQQMAIAAKLDADDMTEGKDCDCGMKDAPSIKDKDAPHKKMKKTNVKKYDGLGYAPTIKKESHEPGKPAEKLGAVTGIPKDERAAAKERLLAKAKAKRDARLKESAEDRLRDRRMERGGVDGNVDYRRPPAAPNLTGKKKPSGMSALDVVKSQIRAKHGKNAIMDVKKKK